MNTTPSLDSLTRHDAEHKPARRLPGWLIPVALAAGFGLLFAALFRDRLLPAREVQTAVVLATVSDTVSPSPNAAPKTGGLLFQASGWVEPDPLPIKATALVDGVIDNVLVLEGQQVAKGEPLATLIDDDTRLALAAAEQKHRTLVANRTMQVASIAATRKKLEAAKANVLAATTLEEEAIDRFERVKNLERGTIAESEVVSARLRVNREQSLRKAAEASTAEQEAELTRMELETQTKDAEIAAALVAVQQAKLAHDRTRIVSPIEGRVLRLMASPGQKKLLGMDHPDSSTVAVLYQPDKLQVRVDVPLADAAGLQIGQPARIRCSILPDKVFQGEVTRITGEADLQRNTLQAKVRILDPIDTLRPEMLCRVEFLGTVTKPELGPAVGSLATWIPQDALIDGIVWMFDPDSQRVSKRTVQATEDTREGFRRIADGLRPGEQVVIAARDLHEGQRVTSTTAKQ